MNKPCYGCQKRKVGCHSNCKDYFNHKKKLEGNKALQESNREYGDYLYHAVKRMKGARV
ncbi:hypothetical protein ACR77J_12215 [Tissierella praeacuta]|uniref:hypothetical protein n=1 Tax=Tissierella praeacuta TaxID=43131 RepID=UPI003DA46FF1